MRQTIIDLMVDYHGDGDVVTCPPARIVDYSTSCGHVGDSQLPQAMADFLVAKGVTEVALLLDKRDRQVNAMAIDYELTLADEEAFSEIPGNWSLRPDAFDGMTIFESE